MNRELVLRRSLWASVFFNIAGAALFAFPSLPTGRLAGLPADASAVYRAFVVLFVLLFAGAYGYLAAQPEINRPFVAFGAIGKTCAFLTAVALWLAGYVTGLGIVIFSGDLALAALFFWGLAR